MILLSGVVGYNISTGEVQEWLNWLVSKTSVPQGTEGSNPSLSAKDIVLTWRLIIDDMYTIVYTKVYE